VPAAAEDEPEPGLRGGVRAVRHPRSRFHISKCGQGTRSTGVGQGLASIQSALGTLIAYATQPDNVALDGDGRNSPFTAALLKHINTPGLELSSLMKRVRSDVVAATRGHQLPWDHSSLMGEVVLVSARLGKHHTRLLRPLRLPTRCRLPGGRRNPVRLSQGSNFRNSLPDQREMTRVPDAHTRVPPTGLAPISHPAPPQTVSTTPSSPAPSRTKKCSERNWSSMRHLRRWPAVSGGTKHRQGWFHAHRPIRR
jgi:hypothetical protein